MRMMQTIYSLFFLISIIQASSITLNSGVGKCLSDVVTQQLSASYNYLQLSSKFGTTSAYPGFSSLFTKLSDDDSSKSYDLVKFLALRKVKLDRLINTNGINIHNGLTNIIDIRQSLTEVRNQNKEIWKEVIRCHQEANNVNDANVQDYLESHLLEHHIEIDKLLTDIEHRIDDAQISEKKLIIFMIDEELLQTYGDRRKDIFS